MQLPVARSRRGRRDPSGSSSGVSQSDSRRDRRSSVPPSNARALIRCRRNWIAAMKRIGELTMQVANCCQLRQDGDSSALWPKAAEVRSGDPRVPPPRYSHGTGLAYGLRRVCADLGSGPLLVLRHGVAPPAIPARRAAAGKASGTEARDGSDQATCLAWRSKPTWRHRPWEGEGYRNGLGILPWLRVTVAGHPGCPQAVMLRLMRENNLLSPTNRCRRRGGNPQ